jgi:hypothetical protein
VRDPVRIDARILGPLDGGRWIRLGENWRKLIWIRFGEGYNRENAEISQRLNDITFYF